jgi:hypothetical protein
MHCRLRTQKQGQVLHALPVENPETRTGQVLHPLPVENPVFCAQRHTHLFVLLVATFQAAPKTSARTDRLRLRPIARTHTLLLFLQQASRQRLSTVQHEHKTVDEGPPEEETVLAINNF